MEAMIPLRWRARWAMMSARERVLILIMLGLLTIVLLWLGIVRPVNDGLAQARADHLIAVDRAGRIDAAVDALRRSSVATPVLEGALDQVVAQSAGEAGFTLDSQNLVGPDRLAIAIGSARTTALFTWLAALETRGVGVETMTIQPGANGTVSARLMLRAAR